MWEEKLKLMDRYDSTASSYDDRYEDIQKKKFQVIRDELEGSVRVLDVGCGTGLFLKEVSGIANIIIGIDFSIEMLKEAKQRYDEAIVVSADADRLPFFDRTFDTVISLTLLQNMPDPEQTVSEMARVVEDKGKVILTVLKKKYSSKEVENWMISANLKPLRVGRISDSEDVLCIGRCEK